MHLAGDSGGNLAHSVIQTASGCHIVDRADNCFLDTFAGLYCVNVGYDRTQIPEAISKQAHELACYHAYVGHGMEVSITLSKMVLARASDHRSKVHFGLGGSDANTTNVKLVWYYNNILGQAKKKKIFSRWRGYHGSGLLNGSLTGLKIFHDKFDCPLDRIFHTTAPYYYRRSDLSQSEQAFVAQCVADLEMTI